MSVIIRLQNLPWSANALDIRQFFKGLSIPEGGVHIVGGEMGDAFIAFSTDEDARQAMMNDRGKLNEVQVRLLLSSRAEMQKVIETARQQSIMARQKIEALAASAATTVSNVTPLPTPQPPVITTNSLQNILATQLGAAPSFQTYQQQAGITLIANPKTKTESFESTITNRRSSNESSSRDRRPSVSRDRRRSRSRDRNDRSTGRRRHERSPSRSRERDRRNGGRERSSRRSRSRDRSRERSRDHNRNSGRSDRNSKDETTTSNRFSRENTQKPAAKSSDANDASAVKTPAIINPWNLTPANAYETNLGQNSPNVFAAQKQKSNPLNAVLATNTGTAIRQSMPNAYTTSSFIDVDALPVNNMAALPSFQNYSTTTLTTNNYSVNILPNSIAGASVLTSNANSDVIKPFALQNPYTAALQAATSNSNSQDSNSSSTLSSNLQQGKTVFPGLILEKTLDVPQQQPQALAGTNTQNSFQQTSQQPIAFANTNPYAQMYPSLFAQAAAAGTGIANPVRSNIQAQSTNVSEQHTNQKLSGAQDYKNPGREDDPSCSIKISNMCTSTTYSDLRKFFSGLFIPHNGIKMINDKFGIRTGVAYVQFSRSSCISKALVRNNTMLKMKRVSLETVNDEEFENIEDSYRPHREYNSRFDREGGGHRGNFENRQDYSHNSPSQGNDGNSQSNCINLDSERQPFSVIYIEDIPALATEQDIMKMFSTYTIYDILLTPSPENRREFTAYVKFSREEEAKSALEETSRHIIGHRKVRTRQAKVEEMDKAKEKLRLANEQLKKEELAMEEAAKNEMDEEKNMQGNDYNDDDYVGLESDGNNKNSNGRANIPSIFDLQPTNPADLKTNSDGPIDPRLRRQRNNNPFTSNANENLTNCNDMAPSQPIPNFNGPNFNQNFNAPFQMNPMEKNFIVMKNCDYNTRINDVAELLMSSNLDIKHIEPLLNERNMPSGEFIVEFTNFDDTEAAVNSFNNTQFCMRNLRVRLITPQEIADRLGKPFMNYFPSGFGRGGSSGGPPMRGNFDFSARGGGNGGPNNMPPQFRMNGGNMGGGGGGDRNMNSRFGNNMNSRGRARDFNGGGGGYNGPPMRSGSGGRGGMQRNFNNQDVDMDDEVHENVECDDINDKSDNDDIVSINSNSCSGGGSGGGGGGSSVGIISAGGIPEKFSRPGCVVSMENVPYKADLKDIMEFFAEFNVNPDDIIRRFNDDGSPTGDARVAFGTPSEARAAFNAMRQHSIFNRIIYLNLL